MQHVTVKNRRTGEIIQADFIHGNGQRPQFSVCGTPKTDKEFDRLFKIMFPNDDLQEGPDEAGTVRDGIRQLPEVNRRLIVGAFIAHTDLPISEIVQFVELFPTSYTFTIQTETRTFTGRLDYNGCYKAGSFTEEQ